MSNLEDNIGLIADILDTSFAVDKETNAIVSCATANVTCKTCRFGYYDEVDENWICGSSAEKWTKWLREEVSL